MFDAVTTALLQFTGSPLIFVVILLACLIDGFFPPFPSEAIVVAVAAVAVSSGSPSLILVILAAAVGAALGDNVAYTIGARIGTDRFAWMRRPRVAALLERVRGQLSARPARILLIGRYIPVGRVVVTMAAGAVRVPRRTFIPVTAIGATLWAAYSAGVAVLAGAFLHGNPVAAAAIGVVLAFLVGLVLDRVARRRARLAGSVG